MSDAHRCLAGPACRRAEITDDGRQGALTAAPDAACDACLEHFEDGCRQLSRDWEQLRDSLGDQQSGAADLVRSTPSPAVPIDTTAEAIMAAIVDVMDRAAAVVSDRLGCGHPSDRRFPLPKARAEGRVVDAARGSVAYRTHTAVRPTPWQQLQACLRLVLPNIDVLCRAPEQPAVVWDKNSPADLASTEWFKAAKGRYYPLNSNGRTITQQSGIDLALQIANLHRQTRAHMGHTRLRHRYPMPCPAVDKHGNYCGAMTVGRTDGNECVDCTTCGAAWTQNEYEFLAGLTAEEMIGEHYLDPTQRLEAYRMLQRLLAEAYSRLDEMRAVLDKLSSTDTVAGFDELDLPGAGRIIYEALDKILEGHEPPENRRTA